MKWFIFLFVIYVTSCQNQKEKQIPAVTISEEDSLLKMVNLYPDSVILRENMIQFYRDQGNYAKAIAPLNCNIKFIIINKLNQIPFNKFNHILLYPRSHKLHLHILHHKQHYTIHMNITQNTK